MKYKEFARFKWIGCHVEDISQQHLPSDKRIKYIALIWDGENILLHPVGWKAYVSHTKGPLWVHYSHLKVTWPTNV